MQGASKWLVRAYRHPIPPYTQGDWIMSAIRFAGAACALALGVAALSASAAVVVGGSAMFPHKNIVENAVNSKDHTTLVAAGKAAGIVETLEGKRPFTVFAPVNP